MTFFRRLCGGAFFATALAATFCLAADPSGPKSDTGSSPEKAIEIPLKDIWAYMIPGTKDVQELDPDSIGKGATSAQERDRLIKSSRVERILSTLRYKSASDSPPKHGFAVSGAPDEALRKTYEILVNDKTPARSFSEADDISVVFASRDSGSEFGLDSVKKKRGEVAVLYRFKVTLTRTYWAHFAIIPVGKLPSGKYDVNFNAANDSRKSEADDARNVVFKSFSFEVTKGQK